MAKINFPPTPEKQDVFTDTNTGQLFVYNGEAWVRTKQGTGIPEPLGEGVQYARLVQTQGLPGEWVKVATDIWYLGAFANHPYFDHEGKPVVKGHVYFNTVDEINYSYTGIEWREFADVMYVFGLQSYTYVATDAQTTFNGPDNYGNTPVNWVEGATIVAIHLEGVEQDEDRTGGTVPIGDYTVDYSTNTVVFNTGVFLNEVVKISTYLSMPGNDASLFPFVIDEDDMATDSDTKIPTQQSVKAYVDVVDTYARNINTGYKNILINSRLGPDTANNVYPWIINQRGFNGNWSGSGIHNKFGFDRWTAIAFTTTIRDIRQQIEQANLVDGATYTLSWEGGSTDGQILLGDRNTAGSSPLKLVTNIIGTDGYNYVQVPYNAYNIQLEQSSAASTFEIRPVSLEKLLCQRYYNFAEQYVFIPLVDGISRRVYTYQYPVEMHRIPYVDSTSAKTGGNWTIDSPAWQQASKTAAIFDGTITSSTSDGNYSTTRNIVLDAEIL